MASKLSTLIGALSAKSPPIDADKVPILDSADSGNFGYSTWAVFKSTLKTYFDGLYSVSAHAHGNVTTAGAIGSTTDLPVITTTAGALTVGAFGNGATNFCAGNDSRLSDARTPASHVHGNITNAGAIGSTTSLPIITTTSGVLTVGAFGTGATNFAAGDHTHSGVYAPAALNDATSLAKLQAAALSF